MPIASEVGAAFRLRVPPVLVRGADSTTRIEGRLGGAAAAITAASYRLQGPTGETLHTASPAPSAGVVSVTVPSSALPSTLSYGPGYREFWTVTIDGADHTVTRPAYLAAYPLHCPVTQVELENEYPAIASMFRGVDNLQEFIDSAWTDTLTRLLSEGEWPEAIVDSETLIPYVRESALHRVFRAAALGEDIAGGPYSRAAEDHRASAREAWARVSYRRDDDQDGRADSDDRHTRTMIVRRTGGVHYEYRLRRHKTRKVF